MSNEAKKFDSFGNITTLNDGGLFCVGQNENNTQKFRTMTKESFVAQFLNEFKTETITRANLLLLIADNGLEANKKYYISDVLSGLFVVATSTNTLSEIAVAANGKAYVYNVTDNTYFLLKKNPAFVELTDEATIVLDFSTGENFEVTLAGSRTLSITNINDGDSGILFITQDATGNRTLTLPNGSLVLNGGAGALDLSTSANAIDVVSFIKKGNVLIFSLNANAN